MWWAPVAGGAVVIGVGALLFGLSGGRTGHANDERLSAEEWHQLLAMPVSAIAAMLAGAVPVACSVAVFTPAPVEAGRN